MIDLSPETFRALGYRAVDLIVERLTALPYTPVRQPVPAEIREQLMRSPLPTEGSDPADVLNRIAELVLPYPMGNASGRFFAWVNSPPAPLGVLGELIAAAHDPSVAGGDHAATYVEHGVLNWIKSIFGYPADSGAILTSGGSVATLIGLAVMRHVKSEGAVRAQGFQNAAAPMVIYASTQAHSCVQKAAELLGFGSDYLHKIPVDSDYCMDVGALAQQIAADRAAGLRPVCVVASAGTVNTGAIDPFALLADLCQRENLWLHVDGAYGGFGILAEQTAGLYEGIARADSLGVDPHKWLYVPVECGCTIVRDAEAMRDAFSLVRHPTCATTARCPGSRSSASSRRAASGRLLWMTFQQLGLTATANSSATTRLAQTLREKICARP
ncbi:MAG: pyridoxal-dependent decarboxylase [Anaerolineae bacterium]